MVIQRSFKAAYDYHHHITFADNNNNNNNNNNSGDVLQQSRTGTSTSEDSNSSNQNISTSATVFLPQASDTKKFITTTEMATDVLTSLKKRRRENQNSIGINNKTFSNTDTVLRALELLRINIQSAFDKEIDDIVKKYLNIYFQPAFQNIKNNIEGYCGSEEILDVMKCALIENSKFQYKTKTDHPRSILLLTTAQNIAANQSRCHQKPLISTQKPTSELLNNSQARNNIPINTPKAGLLKRSFVANIAATSDSTSIPTKRTVILQKDTSTVGNGVAVQKITPAQRRQIYWHTANISTETYFVLDVQANQAFGFNPDGRERLASKHPELIRYLPDGQDRDWLVQQKIIPTQNRSSRFLLLVYDEVLKLGNSDLYKFRENLNLQVLQPFTIPYFTIQKMKTFFIDLNIKSRGLITNSYTSNIINIRPTNTSCSSSISDLTATTTTSTIGETFTLPITTTTNVKLTNNSQLRNALLQTSQRTTVERKMDNTTAAAALDVTATNFENHILVTDVASSITSTANDLIHESNQQKSHTIPSSHQISQKLTNHQVVASVLKSKGKSVLSSSHATLTALLTNNNNFSRNNSYNNNNNQKNN